MSITLNATLKAAQDGVNHRPIVEITSSPAAAEPPVYGNYLNITSNNENSPNFILLSTGALAGVYVRDGHLYYNYTDTERTTFVEIDLGAVASIDSASLCEMTDNNVGIIYTVGTDLKYKIIEPDGTAVSNGSIVTGLSWVGTPHVVTLANNSYLLVYAEGTGSPPDTGNSYYLKKRTSSNFTSWSSGTIITLSSLLTTNYKNNPNLFQITSNRIFLHFDYMNIYQNGCEVNNVYSIYSDNNGLSWSSPYKITSYTELGTKGLDPNVGEMEDTDLIMLYTEEAVVKTLDKNMSGYPYPEFDTKVLFYNDVDDKLYIHAADNYMDTFQAIVDIDIPEWEYERSYTTETSPALPKSSQTPLWSAYSSSKSAQYSVHKNNYILSVINHETETIINYCNAPGQTVNQNLPDMDSCQYCPVVRPRRVFIRVTDEYERLYIIYEAIYLFNNRNIFGYIDLTEQPNPITGYYTWNELCSIANKGTNNFVMCESVQYIPELSYFMITTKKSGIYGSGVQGVWIFNENGDTIYDLYHNMNSGLPVEGMYEAVHINGYIYFTYSYDASYPDRRGLGRVSLSDNSVVYFEPNWTSANDYGLASLTVIETTKILMTTNTGIAIFDTSISSWEIFNNDTMPGFLPGCSQNHWGYGLGYDPLNKIVYSAYWGGLGDCTPRIMSFSTEGAFSIIKYLEIENPDTSPSYQSSANFTWNVYETHSCIIFDPDYKIWAFWKHTSIDEEMSIMWVNIAGDKNLSNFLIKDSDVTIKWDIEKPTKLEFTLSNGHLFDPQNHSSTYSIFLRKGRKITIKLGEMISSVEYFQDQGEFFLKKTSLSYTVKDYPQIKIVAEDMRTMWEDNMIIATQWFNGDQPKNVIETVLHNNADLEYSDMNIPTLSGSHGLYHQFIDMTIEDIIKEILDHFMYFPFVDVDGLFKPRLINLDKAADHIYSNLTKITKFTPDDSYSTFINRIIAKGMSDTYSEILFEEESITSISGTTGWWGKKTNEIVWYSEDQNRTCRHPRLVILQSVSEFKSFLDAFSSGGHEYISSVDPNEHYVIITIQAPNLMGAFLASIVALIIVGSMASHCDITHSCGAYIGATCVAASVVLNILGAVASYHYDIWARPIGHEKRTFQAEANDYQLQEELNGKVITEIIDDSFCYTISSCQTVADQELEVVKAQRQRVKFEKTSHLQDEIGDVIIVKHPQSNEDVKSLITNLKRIYKVGKETRDYFEGWRLL